MKRKENKERKGAAECIATVILKVQEKWAKGMERIASRLSTKALKLYVINIAVLASCYSAFIIYSAIWQSANLFPKIESIQKPNVTIGRNEYKLPGDTVSQRRIKEFRQHLDSLGRSESGRKARDSFLQQRPGLMDSLQRLEELLR